MCVPQKRFDFRKDNVILKNVLWKKSVILNAYFIFKFPSFGGFSFEFHTELGKMAEYFNIFTVDPWILQTEGKVFWWI